MKATTRIAVVIGALVLALGLLGLIYGWVSTMGENLVYYWSPSELIQKGDAARTATVRLGGQVVPGSIDWSAEDQRLAFRITDGQGVVPVSCTGAPPQMFREGIGVVVEGSMGADGVFHTDRVMVKHSNEYRAPEDGDDAKHIYDASTLVEEGA
jgi:cytochrome c-type biogenesis protein CcmE